MIKIIFYEWDIGFRTIPFIKLLNEKCNLSLIEARIPELLFSYGYQLLNYFSRIVVE